MAQIVLTNAYVSLGGTEVSDHVKSVTLNYEAEAVDATAMGNSTKANKAGLKNVSAEVELHQDYADNGIDEVVFALIGTAAAVAIRPVNTAIGAGNPEYQFTGLFTSYQPVTGGVGEGASTKVTIVAGSGNLVRDITP